MRHRFFKGSLPFLLVSSLLCHALPFTPAHAQPESVFGERIEVRVVNLEVVVEDKDGNRVNNLRPEDFRLRVDRKDVPISFFSEIAEGRRASEAVATMEAPTSANPTGAEPGEAVGTSYLVFVDHFFTQRARDLSAVLDGISEEVGRLGPRDSMAMVAFNGRKLQLLSNWTRSQRQLQSAIDRARTGRVSGIRTSSALDDFSEIDQLDVNEVPAGEAALGDGTISASSREARACAAIQQIESHLDRLVLGVTSTMRSFAQPPGRKVMLMLSGGWPQSAYEYVLGQSDPFSRTGECSHKGSKILRPMYDVANLLGYTLYPIDVPSSRMDISAAEDDAEALARTGPGIPGSNTLVTTQSFREYEIHSTLRSIAAETGGLPMINETRLTAMDRVIEDTRSYYWLGFTPEWKGDDKNRKIKLEILKPGLKIRYREGFQDLSRSTEVDFMVESALLFGELPGASPLGLTLGPVPKRGRRVELPLELKIPMDAITMLPYQGRYVAELELRVGALDENGDRNEIAAVPVVLEGAAPPPLGAHAIYAVNIRVRRQAQNLVVSLYDPVGDRILVASTHFDP